MIRKPWFIAGVGVAIVSSGVMGYIHGVVTTNDARDAQELKLVRIQNEEMQRLAKHESELEKRLADAQAKETIRTVEVIKYVPKVTTGRECFNADTVRLLNRRTETGVPATAGKPAEPNASGVATDTDVANWAALAQHSYTTCAAKLNTLIDFHERKD